MCEHTMASKHALNTGRQPEIDYIKALGIVAMVIGHVYEELSVIDSFTMPPQSIFRNSCELILALFAPIFMLAMGFGVVYAKHSDPKSMAKRGINLFVIGLLLNLCRGMLQVIFHALGLAYDGYTLYEDLFMVDILPFAGLAFLSIALMKKLKLSPYIMLSIALALQLITQFCVQPLLAAQALPEWIITILAFFVNCSGCSCFPLFQWLFYPTLGIVFGLYLQRTACKDSLYRKGALIGMAGLGASIAIAALTGTDIKVTYELYNDHFYNQTLLHYAFLTSIILLLMFGVYHLSKRVQSEPINKAIRFLSTKLNVIYIVQWLVIYYFGISICNIVGARLSEPMIIPAGIVYLLASIGITSLYMRIVERKRRA